MKNDNNSDNKIRRRKASSSNSSSQSPVRRSSSTRASSSSSSANSSRGSDNKIRRRKASSSNSSSQSPVRRSSSTRASSSSSSANSSRGSSSSSNGVRNSSSSVKRKRKVPSGRKKRKLSKIKVFGVTCLVLFVVGIAAVGGVTFSALRDVKPVTLADLNKRTYVTTTLLYSNGKKMSTAPSSNKKTPVPLSQMSPYLRKAIVAIEDERFYQHGGFDPKGLARSVVMRFFGKRTPVPLSQMSPYLRKAIVAIEDERFYQHGGFDPKGLARSVVMRFFGKRQGGSTIPMQVSKMLLTSTEQTISRKIKDIYYAVEMDKKLKKDDILELYLNNFFVGKGLSGAEAGARGYFDKSRTSISDVSIFEKSYSSYRG